MSLQIYKHILEQDPFLEIQKDYKEVIRCEDVLCNQNSLNKKSLILRLSFCPFTQLSANLLSTLLRIYLKYHEERSINNSGFF